MKLPVSESTYKKLIHDLFDEIYVELEKSTVRNGGIGVYEIGLDRFYFYPNYSKLSNEEIVAPYFELFDYKTDKQELKKILLERLTKKYNIDYESLQKEVALWAELKDDRKGFNETIFERLITSFSFTTFYDIFGSEKVLCDDYFSNLKYHDLANKSKYEIRSFGSTIDETCFLTPLTESIDFENPLQINRVNNLITTDLIYFYDKFFDENIDFGKSPFYNLLEVFRKSNVNPLVDLTYELIVYRFLYVEKELDEIAFLARNKYNSFLNFGNSLTENNLIELIDKFYEIIHFDRHLEIIPSLKTNKKVADLFSKILILVLNNRLPNHDEFKTKIAALYDNEDNKLKKAGLEPTDYKKIDTIFDCSRFPLKTLDASNLALLFHSLKEKEIIHNLNNSQLSLLISLLTGKSQQNIGRELGNVSKLKSYNTKKAKNYIEPVREVLQEIIDKLK